VARWLCGRFPLCLAARGRISATGCYDERRLIVRPASTRAEPRRISVIGSGTREGAAVRSRAQTSRSDPRDTLENERRSAHANSAPSARRFVRVLVGMFLTMICAANRRMSAALKEGASALPDEPRESSRKLALSRERGRHESAVSATFVLYPERYRDTSSALNVGLLDTLSRTSADFARAPHNFARSLSRSHGEHEGHEDALLPKGLRDLRVLRIFVMRDLRITTTGSWISSPSVSVQKKRRDTRPAAKGR
jgi:hypothetical protein